MSAVFAGYGVAVTVVAVMISVFGIVYGLGIALDDKKIKEFGKYEIYQSLINGAIIGFLFIAFTPNGVITAVINNFSSGVTSQPCSPPMAYNSAICFSYNYLFGSLSVGVNGNTYPSLIASTLALLTSTTVLYMMIGTLSTVSFSIVVISVGLAGLNIFLGPLRDIIDLLVLNLFLIIAQAALLKFIAATAISMVLPIGLVLRSFFFTRRLGGTLIAIAIGFFAVYPLTYVLAAQLLNSYSTGGQFAQEVNNATNAVGGSVATAKGIEGATYSDAKGVITSPATYLLGFNPIGDAAGMILGLGNGFSSLMSALGSVVSDLIIQVFILPIFSLILTIISVRELANIMGSEVSFGKFDVL